MATTTAADIDRSVESTTIATAFLQTVAAHGDLVALRERGHDDEWLEWTFSEYAEHVAGAAAGLRALGVGPGDRVVLMMRNTVAFHMLDMAVVFCGATPISIYNSSSAEQVAYLTGHCGAKVGIVEDAGYLERFLKVQDELPSLERLAIVNDPDEVAGPEVWTFPQLVHEHGSIDLEEGASMVSPDTLATVIYTSGTTGPPKGVMLSQYNVMWTAESLKQAFGREIDLTGYRLVSYLPMAHIAERMTSHYMQTINAYEITSCPEPGQVAAYLREVRPNIVFGVPRVWEKLHAGVLAAISADATRAQQFTEGVEAAKPISVARAWGKATAEQDATWAFLQEVAFNPVKVTLGLDQVEFAISGAAPITRDLLEWFNAIGVPLSEIYGMSESSGPMTWAPVRIKPGTVGPAIPGCEVALADDGEVVCRGGNVFLGYLNDADKTAETLQDGWLHSGDIGEVDQDGYFKIVDRKKELLITAGGKNISPANLEAALKTVPLIGQACAIGDQRPFVSALVVLDPETAEVWAKAHNVAHSSVAELVDNSEVVAEVEAGVGEVMKQFNNAERVKKVKILGDEWLPDSEELTPTSKLKRRGIFAKYATEIEALYS
ncbi:MAG TPA: AMP-binding protein [Acidimicrobiales bacterium]|nr:AMP-binding protein [Acidimicrobiales bacterium]